MRQVFFVFFVLIAAGSADVPRGVAQITAPVFFSHYNIVPRMSTLDQTGGLSPAILRYRVSGNYDFLRSFLAPVELPPAGAKFENSDVIGTLLALTPTPVTLDVDKVFNLDGLTGKQLPVASLLNVYDFQGTNSDGASVNLYATLSGPWMYLRGTTQSANGSPLGYQLHALARTGPFADLNVDGAVNASDYTILRKNGSGTATDVAIGATLADWQMEFNDTMPDIASMDAQLSAALMSETLSTTSVPEPATAFLAAITLALLAFGYRFRPTFSPQLR